MEKLVVRGTEINVQRALKRDDYLRYITQNWLRNRNTIEFLGVWETLYNL